MQFFSKTDEMTLARTFASKRRFLFDLCFSAKISVLLEKVLYV